LLEIHLPLGECCIADCLTESNDSMVEYAVAGLCNLALGRNCRCYNLFVVSCGTEVSGKLQMFGM